LSKHVSVDDGGLISCCSAVFQACMGFARRQL